MFSVLGDYGDRHAKGEVGGRGGEQPTPNKPVLAPFPCLLAFVTRPTVGGWLVSGFRLEGEVVW